MSDVDARWQALKDYHEAEKQRFHKICDGFTSEQTVPLAIAMSVHGAHESALARMRELEAQP